MEAQTQQPHHSPVQGRKYKSRKERPCDACRRRKVCCIREPGDTACSLCRMQSQTCSYDQGPTPRRRRPQAAVPHPKLSQTSDDAAAPSRLSIPSSNLTQPSACIEWISRYVGHSGDHDPLVLRHADFDGLNSFRNGNWACQRLQDDSVHPAFFTLTPEVLSETKPSYYPSSSLLEAGYPLHHELLSTYFEVIHPSFPLLDPARFTKGNKIDLPLLGAMYSLAQPFCPQARNLPCADIDAFVSQALAIEAHMPRLSSIEAALLSLQRPAREAVSLIPAGCHAEIGRLIGTCYDAGLNVDPSKWNLSASDRGRRIRIWWAVYIFDQWTALGLGRPSFIHGDNCNVPIPILTDISVSTVGDASLPNTSALMFIAMAALTQILAGILTSFYTLRATELTRSAYPRDIGSLKDSFEQQLAAFRSRYLTSLEHITDLFLDPTGTLFLACTNVEIVLYRGMLRCTAENERLHSELRLKSKCAVRSGSKLLENLQVSRLRAFWWSPISQLNFSLASGFMFSMLFTSGSVEEKNHWKSEIAHYRRLLAMHSHSFDVTKHATQRMSILADMIPNDRAQRIRSGDSGPKQAFRRNSNIELNAL